MEQQNNVEPEQNNGKEAIPSVTPEEEMEALKSEKEQLKSTLQRAQADLVNYRNRAEAERNDLLKYGNSRLLVRLLPILDDFNLALDQAPNSETPEPWLEGFRLIHRKLHSLMDSEGVTQIEAEGKSFDPSEHEALAQQESADHEDGQVMSVVRDGYKLQGRVLRPAQVIVAKNTKAAKSKTKTESYSEEKEG